MLNKTRILVARSRRLLARAVRSVVPEPRVAPWSWEDVGRKALSVAPGNPHAARKLIEALTELSPNSPDLHLQHGQLLRSMHLPADALAAYRRCLSIRPDDLLSLLGALDSAFDLEPSADAAMATLEALGVVASSAPALRMRLALRLIEARAYAHASTQVRDVFGARCLAIEGDDRAIGKYSVLVDFHDGGYTIRFGSNYLGWPFLTDRLVALGGYLDRAAAGPARRGVLRISLGDAPDGEEPQLCFSARPHPNHHLIPDPFFLQSDGYRNFRLAAAQAPKWAERNATAYWRGSLTGDAHTLETAVALPRVQLALLAHSDPRIDAKITDLSQFGPLLPNLELIMQGLDVLSDKEANERNLDYRHLVDVDGNTNSWPGLYTKLLAGGMVVKLSSPFRQWYYDRLQGGRELILVDSVWPGVGEALTWAERNPEEAQLIAQRGQALALGMTPESEYSYFEAALLRALEAA